MNAHSKSRIILATAVALASVGAAGTVWAQGLKRTPLQTMDFPAGYVTTLSITDIPAGAVAPRHTHPGVESLYVLEGEITLEVEGQPAKMLKPGDSLQIPQNTIHSAPPSGKPVKLLSTYVVEKGKPLATLSEPK